MARPPHEQTPRQVKPMLPADAYACLQWLSTNMSRYGNNPTEVARFLILRTLDDLTREGVLPKAGMIVEPED
jgi:hypothetical protein